MEVGIYKNRLAAGRMSGMYLVAIFPMGFIGLKGLDFKWLCFNMGTHDF